MGDIAIIGAGMAGLSCATALTAAGHCPRLFDKGRRPSGRMASRVVTAETRDFAFDYGALYLTARDEGFVAQLQAWEAAGVAARWPAAGDDAWVGTPGMDAPLKAMADALDVRWSTHVHGVRRDAQGWWLRLEAEEAGPFAAVVLALPAEQVAPMADGIDDALAALARAHRSAPCWTVMLGFDRAIDAPALLGGGGIIDRAARNGAKPGRTGGEAWTIHATADWSHAQIEAGRDRVVAALTAALGERVPGLPTPVHGAAHRWRYARSAGAGIGCYWADGLGACGDWLIAPRVEAAWVSGRRMAGVVGD
ncbi:MULTISPECIES: NAD(P)/FAD-dependent oxidoreductase [unclassified Sphingomonas]|uniref:NAD(P)/FAD-dependent oxidoreductase n=1 Tax=unclassified Sphingomonas TaxID=196159 RepID=UPI0007009DA5|nr:MULTISPECIES: FAD-dependent oxidoreductase [unclassified Sphingomonas]KQM63165.1 deoxyribodipyrimidine photolyase [Sphingomonas sp. Leaf16]KQN14961.1 deoxyribodipyrimidine photolyase [Sphingomonas sp. Leaf29]KQN20539.1 deoxyribodipyrimidine photolyase [Sphingomonas sp. Leaf32]